MSIIDSTDTRTCDVCGYTAVKPVLFFPWDGEDKTYEVCIECDKILLSIMKSLLAKREKGGIQPEDGTMGESVDYIIGELKKRNFNILYLI